MASARALEQARELLNWANEVTDDPRRTRIDLLQVAHFLAARSRRSPELRALLTEIKDFLAGQVVPEEDLRTAAETGGGWPIIRSLPGPASYFWAGLRIIAHGALRRPVLTDNLESDVDDVAGLTEAVRDTLQQMDQEWARGLTLATAEMTAASDEFQNRLVAAAKDFQQLVAGGEFPRWDEFAEGAEVTEWPPLTLGICPVLGGARNENPKDWEQVVGGGALTTFAACALFIAMGDTEKGVACMVGVVVVLIIVAVITHA
jgi:hypothetical protein